MYRIAIFKIRPEPDTTGYQTNYPAGTRTGYMDTCCIIANFLVHFVVRIEKCIIPCVCFHICVLTHCIGLQLIYVNSWSRWLTSSLKFKCTHSSIALPLLALSVLSQTVTIHNKSIRIQKSKIKRPSTIRLRYPVPGTVLAGTGAEPDSKKRLDIRPTGTGYPVHP